MKNSPEFKILAYLCAVVTVLVSIKVLLGLSGAGVITAALLSEAGMLAGALGLFRLFSAKDAALRAGLASAGKLRDFADGAFVGGLLFCCTMALLLGTGALRLEFRAIAFSELVFKAFIMAAAVCCTAFWEETVFRGYVFSLLARKYGNLYGAMLTGAIFGTMHLLSPVRSAGMVAGTFFSGMLLSYAFLRRRNIYYPAGIHFLWNFLTSFTGSDMFFRVTARNTLFAGVSRVEEGLVVITATALAVFLMAKRCAAERPAAELGRP